MSGTFYETWSGPMTVENYVAIFLSGVAIGILAASVLVYRWQRNPDRDRRT